MFIQTEETPNPRTLKFLPGKTVLKNGTATFVDEEMAKESPLAEVLFKIEHVENVFFGSDFITVTKHETADWALLKPAILTTIMDHFVTGKPILKGQERVTKTDTANADDTPIVKEIKELIDTRVRPAVAEDGGDIVFDSFEDGIVKLELYGACSGCPSSTVTLKDGIENMLKHYIPEVERVEAVNGETHV